jgi:hypothetical protein
LCGTGEIEQKCIRAGCAVCGTSRTGGTDGVAGLAVDVGKVEISAIRTLRVAVAIKGVNLEGRAEGVALVCDIGVYSSSDAALA